MVTERVSSPGGAADAGVGVAARDSVPDLAGGCWHRALGGLGPVYSTPSMVTERVSSPGGAADAGVGVGVGVGARLRPGPDGVLGMRWDSSWRQLGAFPAQLGSLGFRSVIVNGSMLADWAGCGC